jgi:uncharacterized membrane protein YqaE (UPF0057 family)
MNRGTCERCKRITASEAGVMLDKGKWNAGVVFAAALTLFAALVPAFIHFLYSLVR